MPAVAARCSQWLWRMNDLVMLRKDRVREIIRANELKKWWVAEFSGVHKTTLRRWLNGRIDRIQERHVRQLAAVLEVEPSSLVASDGEKAVGASVLAVRSRKHSAS